MSERYTVAVGHTEVALALIGLVIDDGWPLESGNTGKRYGPQDIRVRSAEWLDGRGLLLVTFDCLDVTDVR